MKFHILMKEICNDAIFDNVVEWQNDLCMLKHVKNNIIVYDVYHVE